MGVDIQLLAVPDAQGKRIVDTGQIPVQGQGGVLDIGQIVVGHGAGAHAARDGQVHQGFSFGQV